MSPIREIYRAPDVPDLQYGPFKDRAGGDVLEAVDRGFQQLLCVVAGMPARAASLGVRFVYHPDPAEDTPQSRLTVSLYFTCEEKKRARCLRTALTRGPVAPFYELEQAGEQMGQVNDIQALCDVVRAESAKEPLWGQEFNPHIPPFYYRISPFSSDERNTYMQLDGVLSGLDEPVIVDICGTPWDASEEVVAHTRYLANLQAVNRRWDYEEDDYPVETDYFGDDAKISREGEERKISPLRRRDPLAGQIFRTQQRFHENLLYPQLLFHVRVLGESLPTVHLVASEVACCGLSDGQYRLLECRADSPGFEEAVAGVQDGKVATLPVHRLTFQSPETYPQLANLGNLATVDELAGLFRLPVAEGRSPQCIRKNTDPPARSPEELIVLGHDLQLSECASAREFTRVCRGIPVAQVAKHIFICGMSGYGKTTVLDLLRLALHAAGVPTMTLEGVKTEARAMKLLKDHPDPNVRDYAENLEVYTLGVEDTSPLRFNPLEREEGISLNEHLQNRLSCLMANMPAEGPIEALLGEALEEVHSNGTDGHTPLMRELATAAFRVLEQKPYSGEVRSNLRGALETRLGLVTRRAMGQVFQCRRSIPSIRHLMEGHSVQEFDAVPPKLKSSEAVALLMRVREYLRTHPSKDGALRLVIILEEAHQLIGRRSESDPSGEAADPKAYATEFVCNMLAELRALGCGVVISEQFPSRLAREVIKATSTKLAFREVDEEDRHFLAESMLLTDSEYEDIARLEPGEAYLFTEKYYRPRKIKTIDIHEELSLHDLPSNEELLKCIQEEQWHKEATEKRLAAEMGLLVDRMDAFDRERNRIVDRTAALRAEYPRILAEEKREARRRRLTRLGNEARKLRGRLASAYRRFVEGPYRNLMPAEEALEGFPKEVAELHAECEGRFTEVIKPDTKSCLDVLDKLITLSRKQRRE